jgi:hypothetical protein
MPRNGVDRRGAASPRTFKGDGRESAHEGEHDQLVRAWASTDCERAGDGALGLLFEASLVPPHEQEQPDQKSRRQQKRGEPDRPCQGVN